LICGRAAGAQLARIIHRSCHNLGNCNPLRHNPSPHSQSRANRHIPLRHIRPQRFPRSQSLHSQQWGNQGGRERNQNLSCRANCRAGGGDLFLALLVSRSGSLAQDLRICKRAAGDGKRGQPQLNRPPRWCVLYIESRARPHAEPDRRSQTLFWGKDAAGSRQSRRRLTGESGCQKLSQSWARLRKSCS
jgi:hypothetical protein